MPASNFERSLTAVLKHEAGYVDHPRDPGGATNMGITFATLRAWRGKPITKQDVRFLERAEAAAIYRAQYWNAVRGDDLPDGLDYAMFDYAVNSGAGKAIRDLQAVLGVQRDGQIGAITLDKITQFGVRTVIAKLMDRRLAFLKGLKTWDVFGKGWGRRVADVRAVSLRMAVGAAPRSTTMPAAEPAQGKARVADAKTASTPEGKAAVITGVGTAGTALTEAADKIAPLGEMSGVFRVVFGVLVLAGVGFMLYSVWQRYKQGELA